MPSLASKDVETPIRELFLDNKDVEAKEAKEEF